MSQSVDRFIVSFLGQKRKLFLGLFVSFISVFFGFSLAFWSRRRLNNSMRDAGCVCHDPCRPYWKPLSLQWPTRTELEKEIENWLSRAICVAFDI